jgi:hypothetical protein
MARTAGRSCMHPPYPCRKARRSRKGRGSEAWWEKARNNKTTKPNRASIRCTRRKLHCLKPSPHGLNSADIERWLKRCTGTTRKPDERFRVPADPACPRSEGLKGQTGRLNTPHLCHTVNAGSPTQVTEPEAHTCRATEPPYYSKWTCNGVCSQSLRLDRQGYKRMETTRESPAVWEEGRQLLSRAMSPKARAS